MGWLGSSLVLLVLKLLGYVILFNICFLVSLDIMGSFLLAGYHG